MTWKVMTKGMMMTTIVSPWSRPDAIEPTNATDPFIVADEIGPFTSATASHPFSDNQESLEELVRALKRRYSSSADAISSNEVSGPASARLYAVWVSVSF
jgi:hypothetical protein